MNVVPTCMTPFSSYYFLIFSSIMLHFFLVHSWVQTQLKNHPDELWEDGVRDYLAHASSIMVILNMIWCPEVK